MRKPKGADSAVYALLVALVLVLLASSLIFLFSESRPAQTTTTSTRIVTVVSIVTSTGVGNYQNNVTPSAYSLDAVSIYHSLNASVVTLQGVANVSNGLVSAPTQVLGSGFAVSYNGSNYIITNFHVVDSVSNMTVTFWDGNSYPAKAIGTDPYSDLAVVSVQAPTFEFHPLTIAQSNSLVAGQPVAAIGNPFGLSGSITVGIISQLGRTIQDPVAGNFSIADAIQFTAPINPGNSGGPLLNSNGQAVGITTAVVGGSQGVGFAIPSDTILREISSLIANGDYNLHPYLGIYSADMNYWLAKAEGTNVTYGVLIEQTAPGGPAASAGIRGGNKVATVLGQQYLIGGDIIVSLNGTKIVNLDSLATYLESHAFSGQTIQVGIIRAGQNMTVPVVLGTRPPL